jgi:hypothetical protein
LYFQDSGLAASIAEKQGLIGQFPELGDLGAVFFYLQVLGWSGSGLAFSFRSLKLTKSTLR